MYICTYFWIGFRLWIKQNSLAVSSAGVVGGEESSRCTTAVAEIRSDSRVGSGGSSPEFDSMALYKNKCSFQIISSGRAGPSRFATNSTARQQPLPPPLPAITLNQLKVSHSELLRAFTIRIRGRQRTGTASLSFEVGIASRSPS